MRCAGEERASACRVRDRTELMLASHHGSSAMNRNHGCLHLGRRACRAAGLREAVSCRVESAHGGLPTQSIFRYFPRGHATNFRNGRDSRGCIVHCIRTRGAPHSPNTTDAPIGNGREGPTCTHVAGMASLSKKDQRVRVPYCQSNACVSPCDACRADTARYPSVSPPHAPRLYGATEASADVEPSSS